MNYQAKIQKLFWLPLIIFCFFTTTVQAQSNPLKTPLTQDLLTLLTNEISGQYAFNNEVILAGAPWVRDPQEFTTTFHESQGIYDMVRKYGIDTTELIKYESRGSINYPTEAEFWITAPEPRLVARLGADAAMVAGGAPEADVTGELIYIPPMTSEEINQMLEAGPQEKYQGKIALLWSHARGNFGRALDAAGIQAVISFSSRERFNDPDQVVYSSGSYSNFENLKVGFNVSWRQWSELMEDCEANRKLTARCKVKYQQYPNKIEMVYSWIPGAEPDKKGVIFTAHLFEGYTKRGANDNMSGCVIQLEILRALTKLIETGQIPQPRRTIYFLWPPEISGTNEFLRRNPELPKKYSININMDMGGEGLRLNNAQVEYCESPDHLPSYVDGLIVSILNYVWRTNDIVYLPDSPRGRSGGQYFPKPMVEKNGSWDAFRFLVHDSTGGSDHTCFWREPVSVPGIYLGVWPDQWYHADTDTPDKSDPTQMKRLAFIGAASALAAAHCTDEVLPPLLDVTSDFGFERIAQREIPESLALIEAATAQNLEEETQKALELAAFGINRETKAITSTKEIYTGSPKAIEMVNDHTQQWNLYGDSIQTMLQNYAKIKTKQLKTKK
ncbi:MAG: M28 family peptidase [Planctomycetes bacterium]|nr:M28 family peptidase [Planctomycetota bacterium]